MQASCRQVFTPVDQISWKVRAFSQEHTHASKEWTRRGSVLAHKGAEYSSLLNTFFANLYNISVPAQPFYQCHQSSICTQCPRLNLPGKLAKPHNLVFILTLCQFSRDESVEVMVGEESTKYVLYKPLLCQRSPFFQAAFVGSWTEAARKSIKLEEDDADALNNFVWGMYRDHLPLSTDASTTI